MITSDFALFVWQGNSAFGKLVTLTLMGLGGAAGGAALWHSHRYRVTEMAALDGVRSKLRRLLAADLPGAEGEDGALAPPPTTVELPMLREHVPPGTLIGDRLAALARMKQARVKVHVDALQQVTALSESRRATLAFPAYAVDLAMMLGMLGTFFGLCLMLMQMQGVLPAAGGAADAGGFTRAAASLGSIIASKKTAFVTTLFGLTVAIGVSALNFLLARAQAACYEALERFTVEELLPATAATVEDETAMERLSLHLSDSFATLGQLAENHTRNLQRLQDMQVAFATIVESIRALTQQGSRAPTDEATGALTALARQVTDATGALVRMSEQITQAAVRERERAAHAAPAHRVHRRSWARENPVLVFAGVSAVVAAILLLW